MYRFLFVIFEMIYFDCDRRRLFPAATRITSEINDAVIRRVCRAKKEGRRG